MTAGENAADSSEEVPAQCETGSAETGDRAPLLGSEAGATHAEPGPPTDSASGGGDRPPFSGAFKYVLGIKSLAFYPEAVKTLAERIHPKKVKAAWCVGPVVRLATWMPLVYSATACLVAATTAILSHCNNGKELKWPFWLWFPWLLVGLTLLAAEYRILKNLSVPHYFKADGWKAMPTEILTKAIQKMNGGTAWECWDYFTKEYGFSLWMTWGLFLSGVRLVSFFSANMFIGMVLGDLWMAGKDCDAGAVEEVWKRSLQESRWWLLPSETTLGSIFAFKFAAQIAHFLMGVLHAWPRTGQWYAGKGLKPEDKRHPSASELYEQDLELDIIEFVSWRAPDRVLQERGRPHGTRFSYVTLFGTEVTTSAAVEICAEACGQASIERTLELVFCAENNKVVGAIACAQPEKMPDYWHIREAIVEMRAMIQDARVVLRTVLSHIFLYGVCFSGLVLQAQVTYYYARCFKTAWAGRECKDASGLGIGVGAGFLSVTLTLSKAFKVISYIWSVHSVKLQYATWAEKYEEFIHNDTGDCGQIHRQVLNLQKGLRTYACCIFVVVLLFVVNFLWVATKYCMATFVCEDHIWDVAFPLTDGCVSISKDST